MKKWVQEMKESFVEMKLQEEMKVLRNELEMIERRAYESVDEKSLSYLMSRKTTKKKFGP